MIKRFKKILPQLFLLLSLTLLIDSTCQTTTFRNLIGKAESTDLTIRLSLQGTFSTQVQASYKTNVTFYSKYGKAKQWNSQNLVWEKGNTFILQIPANDLQLDRMYALNVKPDKYMGKLFCGNGKNGTDCTVPQMIIKPGQNTIDLSADTIPSGDIVPQDGKISAYDISSLINDIGKVSGEYITTDINGDGVVNALDYSLVLYSLGKNSADDSMNIVFDTQPTPQQSMTPTLSVTPSVSGTITPTSATVTPTSSISPTVNPNISPTVTPIASPTPVVSPTRTPTPIPTVTSAPTSTPIPTPTRTPTATPIPTATLIPGPQSGTCTGTLNGKVYVSAGIFGNQCRLISNERHHMCVAKQSDCTPDTCISTIRSLVKDMLTSCSNGIATLNEQKTSVSCQVQFTPGNCSPEPTPACTDDRAKC